MPLVTLPSSRSRLHPVQRALIPAALLAAGSFPVWARAEEPSAEAAPQRFEIEGATVEAEAERGFVAAEQSSATKGSLTLRETPQSVTVITRDSLKARQVQDLGQALETAAGVTQYSGTGPFAGRSAWGFNETTIRGIALSGSNDIREDGFISSTYFATPDLAVYDRIEIVKGPSSLYGRGSAGGYVNRVRKTPLSEAQAELGASFGSFELYRIDADLTGPVLGTDAVRARFVAAYEDAGSFVDDVASERAVIAPSFEIDLGSTTRLRLLGLYQEDDFIPNNGFPLLQDGTKFRAPRIRRSLVVGLSNRNEVEWEMWSGTSELEQKIGDDWVAKLRFNASSIVTPNLLDSYAYGTLSPEGDTNLLSSDYRMDRDIWAGELRVEGKLDLLGRPLDIVVGADHSNLDYARRGAYAYLGTVNVYAENFADFPPTTDLTPAENSTSDAEDTGVYFQTQIRPFERLGILLGGRYEWTDSRRDDILNDSVAKNDVGEFTGRAGLVFDVTPSVSAYTLYSQSFDPDIFSVDREGKILDPQEGEIWEVGVKSSWLDERLWTTAAIFRIDRDEIPITDPEAGPGEFFSISSGLQRSDGVELEVNGEPLAGWSLSFGGALLDSEFEERDDPFFGTQPGGTADWQVGFFTSYELQHGTARGLGGGVGVFAIDSRGVSTFTEGAVLPGYERVDLSVFYRGFEPLGVALQVRNVFDARYVEGVDRPGAYAQFGSPTAVLLQLEGRIDDSWWKRWLGT